MITERSISPLLLLRIYTPNLSFRGTASLSLAQQISLRNCQRETCLFSYVLLEALFNAFLLCFPSPEVLSTIFSFVYLCVCVHVCLFLLRATSGCLVGMRDDVRASRWTSRAGIDDIISLTVNTKCQMHVLMSLYQLIILK